MKRFNLLALAAAAALSIACGGDSGESPSPTAPSQGTTTTTTTSGGGCSLPGAPGGLAVTVASTRVTMTWAPVNGASDYLVLVGTTASSSNVISTNTTNPEFFWNGATLGTYYARIQSRNPCGTSGSSNEVAFTVTGQ
jgi:hypothetical protein